MATRFDEAKFSRRPRKDQMPVRFDLKRVPPEGFSGMICLSGDVVGTDVHFHRKRTKPCMAEECEACANGVRLDWRGYLFFWRPRQQEIQCIELTPAAMAPIDSAFTQFRSLRGCKMNLIRVPEKANGRLKAQVFPAAADLSGVPACPGLRKYLCRVWGLEYFSENERVTDEMLRQRANGERPSIHIKRA